MFLLVLDSEQAAIVNAGIASMKALMQARMTRADPDKRFTEIFEIQSVKADNIAMQLAMAPSTRMVPLREALTSDLGQALVQALETQDQALRESLLDRISAIMLERLHTGEVP